MSLLENKKVRVGLEKGSAFCRGLALFALAVMAAAGMVGLVYALLTGADPMDPRF